METQYKDDDASPRRKDIEINTDNDKYKEYEKEKRLGKQYEMFKKLLQPEKDTKNYLTIKDLLSGRKLKKESLRTVQRKITQPKRKKVRHFDILDFYNPKNYEIDDDDEDVAEVEDIAPDYTDDDAWDQYVWEKEAREIEMNSKPMTPYQKHIWELQKKQLDAQFEKYKYLREKWVEKEKGKEKERKEEMNEELKSLYKIIRDEDEKYQKE